MLMPSMHGVASSSVWAEPVERLDRHLAATKTLHAQVKLAFRQLCALARAGADEGTGR